jgi:hypothetical protein
MTVEKDNREEGFGSELRRRQSPKLARQQRRNSLVAGLLGIFMGLVTLVDGIDATRTGRMVHFGAHNALTIPGWLAALAGLFVLFLSGFVLRRFVLRRSDR